MTSYAIDVRDAPHREMEALVLETVTYDPSPEEPTQAAASDVTRRHRTTITGIRDACTTAVLTDPSSVPAIAPWPRLPTTMS